MDNFFIKKYPSLKNRQFVFFALSELFSLSGGYIQSVALSAMITETSDKRLMLGIFLFVCYFPVFALSFFTGKLTRKFSPVTVLRVTEIMLLAMSVLLFVFYKMPYPMLLCFGGVWGVIRAFQTPAAASMPKLLCNDSSGVALFSFVMSFSRALGPILSGVLYTTLDYRAAFFVNVLSYVPSLFLLFKLKPVTPNSDGAEGKPRLLLPLLVTVFAVSLFGTAYNIIFTGLTQKLDLPRLWFSVFMALVGVGAALGAWFINRDKPALVAALGISAASAALAFLKLPYIIAAVIIVYGACDYLFFTSAMTRIQTDNPPSLVTRAMGAYTAVTTGALPLGFIGLGFLSDTFGVTAVLVISSLSIAAIYLVFFRKMR